jgi:hypothetical protein
MQKSVYMYMQIHDRAHQISELAGCQTPEREKQPAFRWKRTARQVFP